MKKAGASQRLRLGICLRSSFYPENKIGRFKTMVTITLMSTLTTIQNKHPGPTRRNENHLQSG